MSQATAPVAPSVTSDDEKAAPRRGRPPRIGQGQIIDAAIELGLDAFTMQAIAVRLGVTTPALYSHVSGRDEVLELVNETLRARLHAFSSPATDWRGWLFDFAVLVRTHLASPASSASSASALMVARPGPSAAAQAGIGERGLQLLIADGFTPTEAAYAVWLVFRVAITAGPAREASFAEFVADTGKALAPATAATLPATRAVHHALVADGPHDTFASDLQVVLDGLVAQRRKRRRRRRP